MRARSMSRTGAVARPLDEADRAKPVQCSLRRVNARSFGRVKDQHWDADRVRYLPESLRQACVDVAMQSPVIGL